MANLTNIRLNVLKAAIGGNDSLNKKLQTAFDQAGNDFSKVEDALKKAKVSESLIKKISFVNEVADLTNDNEKLVHKIADLKGVDSLRDFAFKYNKTAISELLLKDLIPEITEGETPEEKKENYTDAFVNKLFQVEPTAMVVNMIWDSSVPLLNDAVGSAVGKILEKNGDINLKTDSVYKIIKKEDTFKDIPADLQPAVRTQLKTLALITALSPVSEAVPALYKAKIHTAFQVSEMSQNQFMEAMESQGLSEDDSKQVYYNAQQTRVRSEQMLISAKESRQGTGISIIDNVRMNQQVRSQGKVEEMPAENNLSWDLLFGDADFCECGECTSVYSPGAYFVELLQYLRNNNLDATPPSDIVQIRGDAKDISGTPLSKLFDRRPDLGCLELTCQNTNTVLPYIDLVNEVMENYVVSKRPKPFNVADETSGELLAEPQHTEYQAYCILKEEVYPFTLPYHQPIDAARIYLRYLETSRQELIDTFRKDHSSSDAVFATLREAAIDRAADAEFLGLTKEEYIILTKECFENKALMERNKTYTDSEYQAKIGVKPVHEYYGYVDKDSLGELKHIKKEFLRRTGIDYSQLVDLLCTQYINPNKPKGKSEMITESLRFSYRFLQNYAVQYSLNKMAEDLVKLEKFADLLPAWKEAMAIFQGKTATCLNSSEEKPEVSDKELKNWVKCHFEKVGKMIVIESGRGCINGRIVIMLEKQISSFYDIRVKNCEILYYIKETWQKFGYIDKDSGKVTFITENEENNLNFLSESYFISDKGEKGEFEYRKEDGFYLIMGEQKEDCLLDNAILQHLDGTALIGDEFDRIHRFIRLWRKLGWTMDEVDKAISGFSDFSESTESEGEKVGTVIQESLCDDCGSDDCHDCEDCKEDASVYTDINPLLIHQLVAVKKLLDQTGIELIRLLSFWGDISTAGKRSLYERLFQTHNVKAIDGIFKADGAGNYLTASTKLSDHKPAIMAALNLSSDDIDAIMEGRADELTLTNLSLLYRYRLLSKALNLRIPAFLTVLPLFGNIFKDAHTTLRFWENWGKMEAAGFTYQQLNFIIRDFDNVSKPFSPSQKTVLQLAKTLYDGLNEIDIAHADVLPREILTNSILSAKASLLFDVRLVQQILQYLEGTATYSTNAPTNLTINIAEDQTLKRKLLYNGTAGTIQVTGILTSAERSVYISLSNTPEWEKALQRIEKQQNKAFKVLFSGIFEQEKTLAPAKKESLETILKSGDISIPLAEILDGQADTDTAPQKYRAFLDIYLPYLRQQLTHRFVITTLADFTGLDQKKTDVLLSEIIKSGETPEFIYHIFEKIKESAKPSETGWSGYLIAPTTAEYSIIIRNSDTVPVVSLDGTTIHFTASEDPSNEWWSARIPLLSGQLYKISSGVNLNTIFWKTSVSAIVSVPSSALIPDFASEQCLPAIVALKKASLLVDTFNLSDDEIRFFQEKGENFDHLDFNTFSLEHFFRLEAYTRLRNALPQAPLSILDFWKYTYDDSSEATLLGEKIAQLTHWKKANIEKLIGHFKLSEKDSFKNEENLLKLQKAWSIADKIGLDIDLLFEWAVPTSHFGKCRKIAEGIKNAMKARCKQTDWEIVVKPLHDELRNNQKNALISHLLQQPEILNWGVTDSNGLFEYFLIDVEMEPCMETSRIKQGISSIQLFIQRCFLGLEEGINPGTLDRPRWEWMQRYRVWQANRKVFLYPENWIETNLRDDKSPFFKELESELLQKDINKQNVTDALKNYLYKVDEVANMEVVGLYIDGTKPINTNQWNAGAKLHVFSRTRNAPYFFFYRYLALDEMNWYPWEKVQIDIPSYDVTDANGAVTGNGCFLTPVAWNGRLLLFFPQIIKKTKPVSTGNRTYEALAKEEVKKSAEYFEVKLAWSEYRNGKWTQKQLSDAIISRDKSAETDIPFFKFVPIPSLTSDVIINFDDTKDKDRNFKGAFKFDGNTLKVGQQPIYLNDPAPIDYFNQSEGKMYSWQFKYLSRENYDIYFFESNGRESAVIGNNSAYLKFHDDNISSLISKVNQGKLEKMFRDNLHLGADAFGGFDDNNNNIYHELKRPYSLYNWELFFHTPMAIANELSKSQHFEEAMKWYHYVFNPMDEGSNDTRFWQFRPFKELNSQKILENIFNALAPNTANQAISEWRDKPFMPHVVARSRPVAYMKWVVMKYLDNLIAWGDYLFRQDTIESINQATQLYVLAWHILGKRPMMIPKRGKTKPQTYLNLLDKWDAFSNAVVELELAMPFSNQTALPIGQNNGEIAFANIFGLASTRYFCIPNNPKLMGYWDTIDDRLYKIRHCQNIQGVFRKLPLFEPPIDPALLVNAAAQGLSIASVLNDLNTPMPNYRFYYLLQKALELCGELKSMGSAMLSAIEKKDNETIALIRARHEGVMHNLVMEIKKTQLEEAEKNLESLQQNRKTPEERMKYYLELAGLDESLVPGETSEFNGLPNEIVTVDGDSSLKLIAFEKEDMDKASAAKDWQIGIGTIETLASVFHAIPQLGSYVAPFGTGATVTWGGSNLGSASQAVARGFQIGSNILTYESSNAGKKGGFTRALQERIQQASQAGFELKQIDKQITASKIRIDIANKEIANQQKMIDNAQEVEDFLKNKYTNEELYTWMRGSLKTLYYQVYSLAYELSKKAEKVYRFERGLSDSNFIQAGYWDAGHDGLLSGEQLYVGLKQLEAAYQNERGYDYEITKYISLRQINPLALLQLRETGKCEFSLPEVFFDMDYPGHYKRRIKSVSLSVPCVAGPYTGTNATFRLLENRFRNTAITGRKYEEDLEDGADERFSNYIIPISAIAASTSQNDSGMFELNFKDERYLPFEGAGCISKWHLELPEIRQFDYNTITDVIVQVRYTASEGGEQLKKAATNNVLTFMKSTEELAREEGLFTVIDIKNELAMEWYKGTSVPDANGNFEIDLSKIPQFLPFYLHSKQDKIMATDIILVTDISSEGYILNDESFSDGVKIGELSTKVLAEQSSKLGNWQLQIPSSAKVAKQMIMVIRMVL